MPVADKFAALGAGNGFPECLQRVDVSIYDHWMTLGGNRDGVPFDESKTGLTECMHFYWNIHAMLCDSSEEYWSVEGGTTTTDYSKTTENPDYPKPKERVCGQELTDLTMSGDFMDFSRLDEFSDWIMAMYDGDEFVGYGINNEVFFSHADLIFSSYAFASEEDGWQIGYSKYDGMNLLTIVIVPTDIDTDQTKIEASADPTLGQYSFSRENYKNNEDPADPPIWVLDSSFTRELQFIGFEFYTYPS